MPINVNLRLIARQAFASFMAALAVSALLHIMTGRPPVAQDVPSSLAEFIAYAAGILIVAPVGETLCIAAIFASLRRRLSDKVAAYISAAALITAHSAISLLWGLIVAIPFVVFTLPFQSIGTRPLREAMITSGLIHALHNSLVLAGLAFTSELT